MGEKVPQSASLYSMSSGTSSCASGFSSGSSATSRASTMSSHSSVESNKLQNHNHNCSTNGCLGAIPRNTYSNFRGHKSHSFRVRNKLNEIGAKYLNGFYRIFLLLQFFQL